MGDIDFCNPGVICSSVDQHPTIAWDIGFFEWIDRIQSYKDDQFSYMEALKQFVDGGMKDGSFINNVSKIVSLGALNAQGTVGNSGQKWSHFNKLLSYLDLNDLKTLKEGKKNSLHSMNVWETSAASQKISNMDVRMSFIAGIAMSMLF